LLPFVLCGGINPVVSSGPPSFMAAQAT
jgi:hypothetical protein